MEYVIDMLTIFRNSPPSKPQHQSYPHINPTYGAKSKYEEAVDESSILRKEKKTIEEVTGILL